MVTALLAEPPSTDAFSRATNPVAIVDLHGEYDITRREELLAKLQGIPVCDIAIIDMRQVTRLDATSLTCFMELRKRLRRSGSGIVRLVGLSPAFHGLFHIADRECSFEAFETVADALGEYGYAVSRQHVNTFATSRTEAYGALAGVLNINRRVNSVLVQEPSEAIYGGYANARGEISLFGESIVYRVNFKNNTIQQRPPLNAGAQARYDAVEAGEIFQYGNVCFQRLSNAQIVEICASGSFRVVPKVL